MSLLRSGWKPPVTHRPFRDWMADAERQCQRRTGLRYAANAAPESYWLAAFNCGMSAHEAADAFIQESR